MLAQGQAWSRPGSGRLIIISTDTILLTYELCHAIDRHASKVYKKAEAGKYE